MRFGAFGDMVLLTVLLRQLQARFGKPVDVISSGPWTRPLLEGHDSIGRLFVIRSRRTPFWLSLHQRQLVAWLRDRGPGPTWFCDLGVGRALLQRGGIPDSYVCDSKLFPWQAGESYADRYVRLGNYSIPAFEGLLPPALPAATRAAQLQITPAARGELDGWLARRGLQGRPFVVIHPGSRHLARRGLRSLAGASKYWPEERWGQVIRAVRDVRPDRAILLSGSPNEYRMNAAIQADAAVQDLHNAADDLPIRRLLPLLERAESMISVDTGPAHAAAALGCPTVALFGTADPALYRPGGATTPAVSLTGTVDGKQNILGIDPDTVVSAWLDLVRTPAVLQIHSVKSVTRD